MTKQIKNECYSAKQRSAAKHELTEKTVETAWNMFFNEDPVRGQEAADAAGRDLMKKLTDGINADNKIHKNTPETVLPILADVAMEFTETVAGGQ